MLSTPTPSRRKPSLGVPSRVARVRDLSPGASSVESGEHAASGPGRHLTGGSSGNAPRQSISHRGVPVGRHSRDPRPVGDRGFAAQCARNVVEFLVCRGFAKNISHDKLLKDPSTKEFYDIFKYLISLIDPKLDVNGKMEDEVPAIMRRMRYPVEVNRSKLQAISGPNTWPQLLAVLDWLTVLVQINEQLIDSIATCDSGLSEATDAERDEGEHQVLRSMHENYIGYLGGKDDHSDEERLKQIYKERGEALQGEIHRMSQQKADMEQRLHEFRSEHDRLLELQNAPKHLEMEADRLRGIVQSQDARVQHAEEATAATEAEQVTHASELEQLQTSARQLQEQVESQPYTKKDIERLLAERGHLKQILRDLRADVEKAEQEVWELGINQSKQADTIGRVVRQINSSIEVLDQALTEDSAASTQDILVHIDFDQDLDEVAAHGFFELHTCVEAATSRQTGHVHSEEQKLHDALEEQRITQEDLSERERNVGRLKVRLEQLSRMRDEYKEWSAVQLDDAQKTTAATEDAMHAVSIGSGSSSLREAAEIDKLKLALNSMRMQGANERAQLEEQVRRDKERQEQQRRGVLKELEANIGAMESLFSEVSAAVGDTPLAEPSNSPRKSHRGGS